VAPVAVDAPREAYVVHVNGFPKCGASSGSHQSMRVAVPARSRIQGKRRKSRRKRLACVRNQLAVAR
jgi:hypothetical protein